MRQFVQEFARLSVRFGVCCAAILLLLAAALLWIPRAVLRFLRLCAVGLCVFGAADLLSVLLSTRLFKK